jgi:hypothetical protein
MMITDFAVGDDVVVCYGNRCGFIGVVTRVLSCFLWVQGSSGFVAYVKKHSVALIVEGDSDEESEMDVDPFEDESEMAFDPRTRSTIIPDYDSDATE